MSCEPEPAVNGTQAAFWQDSEPCRGGCGTLIHRRHGRLYCSDRCRLLAWAKRQAEKDTRQRVLPGESRVERAFREWIESEDGQVVEAEVVRRARLLRAQGIQRWGIASLWESIRYDNTLGLHGEAGAWKLNNSYRSLLARKVMEEHRDLLGFFELRSLRGVA